MEVQSPRKNVFSRPDTKQKGNYVKEDSNTSQKGDGILELKVQSTRQQTTFILSWDISEDSPKMFFGCFARREIRKRTTPQFIFTSISNKEGPKSIWQANKLRLSEAGKIWSSTLNRFYG